MSNESTSLGAGPDAVTRFRNALIEGGLTIAKPGPKAALPATTYTFRAAPNPKVVLGFRDKENRPAIRVSCGYRIVDRGRKLIRILIHIAVMKKVKTSSEKRQLEAFISEKAGNDSIIIWGDGVPTLHARRAGSGSARSSSEPLGIGSRVSVPKQKIEGVVGAFLREKGPPRLDRKVFILSAGHVFVANDLAQPGHQIFYPSASNGKVVAVVDRSAAPEPNTTCAADFGLALKYREIDYDPHSVGDLGNIIGHYSNDEIREMDQTVVAKIERPMQDGFKTAKVIGLLETLEFEIQPDEYGSVENVMLVEWSSTRFSRKGDSGSLLVSVDQKKAVGIVIASKRGQLDGTKNLSYGVSIDSILQECNELDLEIYT